MYGPSKQKRLPETGTDLVHLQVHESGLELLELGLKGKQVSRVDALSRGELVESLVGPGRGQAAVGSDPSKQYFYSYVCVKVDIVSDTQNARREHMQLRTVALFVLNCGQLFKRMLQPATTACFSLL